MSGQCDMTTPLYSGQEEEEEEEEEDQHSFQEDHVDVTNWLDLLDRSITPPLPRES